MTCKASCASATSILPKRAICCSASPMRRPPGNGSAPRRSLRRRRPRLFPRPRCTSPLRPRACARWACPKRSSAHSPPSLSPASPATRAVRGVLEILVPTRPRTGSGAWPVPSRMSSSLSSRHRERLTHLPLRCAPSRGTERLRRSHASIRRISVEWSRSALLTASASPSSTGSASERCAATNRVTGTWSLSESFCSGMQTSTTAIRNVRWSIRAAQPTCFPPRKKTRAAATSAATARISSFAICARTFGSFGRSHNPTSSRVLLSDGGATAIRSYRRQRLRSRASKKRRPARRRTTLPMRAIRRASYVRSALTSAARIRAPGIFRPCRPERSVQSLRCSALVRTPFTKI